MYWFDTISYVFKLLYNCSNVRKTFCFESTRQNKWTICLNNSLKRILWLFWWSTFRSAISKILLHFISITLIWIRNFNFKYMCHFHYKLLMIIPGFVSWMQLELIHTCHSIMKLGRAARSWFHHVTTFSAKAQERGWISCFIDMFNDMFMDTPIKYVYQDPILINEYLFHLQYKRRVSVMTTFGSWGRMNVL